MMKSVFRLLLVLASLGAIAGLTRFLTDNRHLRAEIAQLEAELGRMSIEDPDRVHVVEIESPDVPPEVASHLLHLWQFRCYLPPGYDFVRFNGSGRVTKDGLYVAGGSGSSWGSPSAEATHELFTVSFQSKGNRWEAFYAFGNSSGTSSWENLGSVDREEDLIVQKLVSCELGPRSFDQNTILPLLKIFDPTTAKDEVIHGAQLTTYSGGVFVLCPKSRESQYDQLTHGETPAGFEPNWIAAEASHE